MLGRAWTELLTARDIPFDIADLAQGDLTNPSDVQRLITQHHTHVVNTAAWTDVDGAEAHEPEATLINGAAVANLAARCAQTGAHLTHYSTDYVFNGHATSPYPTDAPRDPVNAYGRSKAAGEIALEQSAATWLCVRTSWLYAPWGANFVRTIAKLASERDSLRVVSDQRGCPTSATRLAHTTLALIDTSATGLHHATDGGGPGGCSWFDFATRIAAAVSPACRVEPCTSAEFPRPAARPAYAVLDLSQTEALVGPMVPWEHALDEVLETLATGTAGPTGP
ncbi:MAG: dTDP-4-dehydrorhamnose reductase [Phycisphaerales bacterium]|jgi:dTDP-4-dehydrorhamnose reductase